MTFRHGDGQWLKTVVGQVQHSHPETFNKETAYKTVEKNETVKRI